MRNIRHMLSPHAVLAHDPTASIECHRPDDRFIAVRSCDLASVLTTDAARFATTPEAMLNVCNAMTEMVDDEVTAYERSLADRYDNFSPDRDTIAQNGISDARTPCAYHELYARLEYLLAKANFIQLSESQIQEAINVANSFGLRVRLNPDQVARLQVWVRGQTRTTRAARCWRHPRRGRPQELTVYRRVVIVAQLRDQSYVNLKLFKEIPITDLEALLPHAQVQMTWLDRIKLFGGGAGVAGSTGMKIFQFIGNIVYWSKLLWVVLFGAGMLTWRVITGYKSARTMRDSIRTRHLYYQSLDHNAGVIHTLSSMIAQEETKEAILAYCVCHASGGAIRSTAELRDRVEAYLAERFGLNVNLDVEVAIETLTRWHLWSDRDYFRVMDPPDAIRQLHEHQQQACSTEYHEQCVLATAVMAQAQVTVDQKIPVDISAIETTSSVGH